MVWAVIDDSFAQRLRRFVFALRFLPFVAPDADAGSGPAAGLVLPAEMVLCGPPDCGGSVLPGGGGGGAAPSQPAGAPAGHFLLVVNPLVEVPEKEQGVH
jgi:hypothetical protein